MAARVMEKTTEKHNNAPQRLGLCAVGHFVFHVGSLSFSPCVDSRAISGALVASCFWQVLCVPNNCFNLCQSDHKEITVPRGEVWALYIKSCA